MDSCNSLKTIFLNECTDDGKIIYVFQIVDGISSNPQIAQSIASGISGTNIIKDIGLEPMTTIISYYQINKKLESNKRMMIVIDITQFPIIKSCIDDSNPNIKYSRINDSFSNDIKTTYSNYDQTTSIPIILVNANIPYTALLISPILTPDEINNLSDSDE